MKKQKNINEPEFDELKNFLIQESNDIQLIEEGLNEFNPFSVLGVENYEIRHSNFLAWLIDPTGNHKAGNFFIRHLINSHDKIDSSLKVKYLLDDLNDVVVYRERRNIDLLIVSDNLKFVICIENKIYSDRSGDNQLLNYAIDVKNEWILKGYNCFFIFLTATKNDLTDVEKVDWVPLLYEDIIEIITLLSCNNNLPEKVVDFILFYIKNFKKNIMPEKDEKVQLAINIYKKHRKVIDYIVSQLPSLNNLKNIENAYNYFVKTQEYELLTPNDKNIIRILPHSVKEYFVNKGFFSWESEIDTMFAIELIFTPSNLIIKFCFGAIKNQKNKFELQDIKNRYFKSMQVFPSLSGKIKKSKPESAYPGIIEEILISNEDFIDSESFEKLFDSKFRVFENDVILPWIKDCKEKLND
jgi:hypothetical protein